MDEGWSVSTDMTKVSSKIDLEEIVEYGKKKGVGVILWATWYALIQQMDDVFEKYSKMGVKGFKIDFFDRDDQKAIASTYEIAEKAAKYKLMVDLHGIYKPTGLQRTYPNVVGFEGVKGWKIPSGREMMFRAMMFLFHSSAWLPVRWIIRRAP